MSLTKTRKTKKAATKKRVKKRKPANKGFDKAWQFWKNTQIDLSGFTFNREEANAR